MYILHIILLVRNNYYSIAGKVYCILLCVCVYAGIIILYNPHAMTVPVQY